MKCTKCGSDVKPNYKFCTKCGQPMVESFPPEPKELKGNIIENNQRFSKVKEPLIISDSDENVSFVSNAVDKIDIIRGKAVWSIGPGQIARRVTDSEYAQLDNMKGIVIQEGVTAIVNVNGQFMGMLSGGYYQFATQSVIEQAESDYNKVQQEEKDAESFLDKIGTTARRLWRFLTGTSEREKVEERKRKKEIVKRNIQKITADSSVNITLVSNRVFEVVFGSVENNGNSYIPLSVKTKVVDIDMGISVQMQVSNINEFLINYLSDRNSLCISDIHTILQPTVFNLLNRVLRNLDYQAEGLPEELVSILKNQIKNSLNERLHGLEVSQVLDITDNSEDFERFRAVEHDLFASEHELSFLQRTGEFRNRLAIETNAQELQEARNKEELRYSLDKINRDGLLHSDEMEAFTELLESQKRLREAKTEEQEYEALQDLRRCHLVKDDDIAMLEEALKKKQIERTEAIELLRLRVYQTTEETRLKAENALSDIKLKYRHGIEKQEQEQKQDLELSAARHQVEKAEFDVRSRRIQEDYEFEKKKKDSDFAHQRAVDEFELYKEKSSFEQQQRRADKMDDLEIIERKSAIARANMQQMHEHEQKLEEMRQKNEALRIETEANMTQEQIVAAHLKDISGLDTSAQVEIAKAISSGKEKEAEMLREQQERERQMYEHMMNMHAKNIQAQQESSNSTQEQMMRMMQMMMDGMTKVGQNNLENQKEKFAMKEDLQEQRYNDQVKMKEEYREDAIRQQGRIDKTQENALNYTTRVTESAHDNNSSITINSNTQPSNKSTFCPNCGARVSSESEICQYCGEPLNE